MSGLTIGIDTSTGATSVGLFSDQVELVRTDQPSQGERPAHAGLTLGFAGDLLTEAGYAWSDVSSIAVGVGPGSFTGLRVGIATAIGLGKGASIEPVGVSSLQALVFGAASKERDVIGVIDARRGEVYIALLRSDGTYGPELVTSETDLVQFVKRSDNPLVVGDGAVLLRESLEVLACEVPPSDDPRNCVSGLELARLSSTAGCEARPLLPSYLRSPDAVPMAR